MLENSECRLNDVQKLQTSVLTIFVVVTSYPRERVLTHFIKKEARSSLYRLSIWLACDLSHPFVSLQRANNG